MPHARTLTSTSSGPTVGRSSDVSSSLRYSVSRSACIVQLESLALGGQRNPQDVHVGRDEQRLAVLTERQFDVAWPVLSVPRCLPSGEKTSTPPGPVANRLPCSSTSRPSGAPWRVLASSVRVEEHLALADRAVLEHRKRHADRPRPVRVGHVERLLVRRERDAVGPLELFGEQRHLAVRRDAIDALEVAAPWPDRPCSFPGRRADR